MSIATDRPLLTLADLMDRLGHVPLQRVRFHPAPGTATVEDVIEIHTRQKRLCELIDGVLVEKAMGYEESVLGVFISGLIGNFVRTRNLGHVSGESGMMQLFPGLVRIPDVAYASWDRFPDRRLTGRPVPLLVPDLAVEVLSLSNTTAEMEIKVDEYFSAGVLRVWLVDPRTRTVRVFDSSETFVRLQAGDTLDGGDLLPGFTLPIDELFAELDRCG